MGPRSSLTRLLVSLVAMSLGPGALAASPTPPPPKEDRVTPLSNPHALARVALDAYRARDLDAWRRLLAEPLPVGATPGTVFAHALTSEDAVHGLYFLDERHVAALVRRAGGGAPALWIELVRARQGGFLVVAFRATAADPPLDDPVEG